MLISTFCARLLTGFAFLLGTPMLAHAIAVTSTTPVGNANNVARNASIEINFDQPLATATITSSSLRVWGALSGPTAGTTSFSNGDQTLTFTPASAFFPGEWVSIQLAHSIGGADSSSLRAAGFSFQFLTRAGAGSMQSTEIDVVSVSLEGETTRLYGGAITDLNHDGWTDYVAVNEISHDLRVLLNRADGSGLLGPVLTPPTAIGSEASPNTVADFNNDGFMDVATGNSSSNNASIALGSGDGHFASVQFLDVGSRPHGIVPLDVDGDGDLDIVVASENGGMLSLLVNDGQGVFGGRVDFANVDGDGKYALGAGDMNGDGILDLVVGTSTDDRILVLKGNGDGTFTETANIAGGGYGWKLTLGDVNNDGKLDVAQANGPNNSGSILLGNGDGTLQPAAIYSFSGTMVGSSLGDLDGDGYLDWVLSSYGSGRWYVLKNNGDGSFSQADEILAPRNASCASLYDFDNDGTLDMALADETSDEIVLRKNGGGTTVLHADVAVTMSADPERYTPGSELTYTITVVNAGPDAANGTSVTDAFPPDYTGVSWTCAASGGASCAPGGNGSIDQSVDLPPGSQVVYTVQGIVASDAIGVLSNTASAAVVAPTVDPTGSNNSATVDISPAGPLDEIFVSGFDG
jgi:uncharacterized repeat protein (TIGR01451 family)